VGVGLASRDHCQPDDSDASNQQYDQHGSDNVGPRAGQRRRHDLRIEAQTTSRRGLSKMMIEPRGIEC
jgi:hypothetical protein